MSNPVPIFSPSLTELWKFCPLKAHLQRIENLEPKHNRNLLARLAGSAVAEGLSVINKEWMRTTTSTAVPPYILSAAKERGTKYLSLASTHYQVCGVPIEQTSIDAKLLEIQRAIERYAKVNPLSGFVIRDVETELTDYGRCRIDLGLINSGGDIAIADVKYKSNLDDKYREKTIKQYLRSWQFKHYAWAYSKYLGKPVPLTYLVLIVMRPAFSVSVIPEEIDPEWMKVWEQSATRSWEDMYQERQGLRVMNTAAVHQDQYGPCEMEGVCFDHKLDIDNAILQDYVRVPQFDFELALQRETANENTN